MKIEITRDAFAEVAVRCAAIRERGDCGHCPLACVCDKKGISQFVDAIVMPESTP